MSTRATYLFKSADKWSGQDICLYNHHDNYPEGAIHFIWAAFKSNDNPNLSAESFIRGNDRFEITDSHEGHGDTEYRYTFHESGTLSLKVEKRIDYGDDWKVIFTGLWWDFVQQYANNEHFPLADFEPFVAFSEKYCKPRYMTKSMLKSYADECAKLIGLWSLNGHTVGANWDSKVEAYQDALELLGNLP